MLLFIFSCLSIYQALKGTAADQPKVIINPQVPDQVQKLVKIKSKVSTIVYRPLEINSVRNIFIKIFLNFIKHRFYAPHFVHFLL